jgi:hypothetical protein
MICVVCKATLPEESRYCLSCGADMSDPSAERRPFDTVAAIQDHLVGAVAGHYKIGKLLGRGGMGTVFLAEDLTLQREVAIKVLPPRLTSEPKFVARFLQEARTSAKLDHPNIIPIYAVQSEGDLHYFAMKYVTGKTIDQLLEDGPLPVEECRRIIADAALALGHAHQRGVVHRDVKPSNIMIENSGRVLLTDFGISKALESATQFTGTGQIVGTPHYMSPEQAKGTKLDGRSDQYSLAVVGYQMLTGRLLFESGAAHTVIYGHIHEPPPSARASRPETPDYVELALMRALAKDPQDRFATMEEFAAAVQPPPSGEQVVATPRPGQRLASSAAGAAPPRRTALAVVGALALVALAYGTFRMSRGAATASPQPAATVPSAPPPSAPAPDPGAAGRAAAPTGGAAKAPGQGAAPSARDAKGAAAPPATAVRPALGAPTAAAAVGYLTVDAEPWGTLSIDGVELGETPKVNHALAPGTHTVRVVRDGYKPWSTQVVIEAGNPQKIRHVLEPIP